MEKVQAGQSIFGDITICFDSDTERIEDVDFLHGIIRVPNGIVVITFESCFFDDIRFEVDNQVEEIIFVNCDLLSSSLREIPESCMVTILSNTER